MNAPFVVPRQAISLETALEAPHLLSNQKNATSFDMSALSSPSISPFTPPVYKASSSQIEASTSSNPILVRSSLTVYNSTTLPILWKPTTPGSKPPKNTDPADFHSSSVKSRLPKASETGGRKTGHCYWSFAASHTRSASPISWISAEPTSTAAATVIMTGSQLRSASSFNSSVSETTSPSSLAIPSSTISHGSLLSSSSSTLSPSSQSNFSPTPTPTLTSTSTPPFSNTTLVAAPIGMTIGLVLLIVLVSWLIRRWRKKRKVGVDGSGSESRNTNLPAHDKRKIRARVLRVHAETVQGEKGRRGDHTRKMEEEEGVGIRA